MNSKVTEETKWSEFVPRKMFGIGEFTVAHGMTGQR